MLYWREDSVLAYFKHIVVWTGNIIWIIYCKLDSQLAFYHHYTGKVASSVLFVTAFEDNISTVVVWVI